MVKLQSLHGIHPLLGLTEMTVAHARRSAPSDYVGLDRRSRVTTRLHIPGDPVDNDSFVQLELWSVRHFGTTDVLKYSTFGGEGPFCPSPS